MPFIPQKSFIFAQQDKEKPFDKVLFGLGIRFVGETVAKKLAKRFGSIDELKKF